MNIAGTLTGLLATGTTFEVRDKVAVITGAGQGIGLELARILHRRGAVVAMLDLDDTKVHTAATQLGPRTFAVAADVADRDGMNDAIAAVRAHFGRIDMVIANAGITPAPATLRTMDPTDFDRVIGVNLTGVFNAIRPALDDIAAPRTVAPRAWEPYALLRGVINVAVDRYLSIDKHAHALLRRLEQCAQRARPPADPDGGRMTSSTP
jgi:NAD(P)-dependent dehydrogenase (short-subunit alcohol dehydrogenase family)